MAQHSRLPARDGEDIDLGQAGRSQQGGHVTGAAGQVRRGGRIGRHRRDPDQALQVGRDRRENPADRLAQLLGRGHGMDVTPGAVASAEPPDGRAGRLITAPQAGPLTRVRQVRGPIGARPGSAADRAAG